MAKRHKKRNSFPAAVALKFINKKTGGKLFAHKNYLVFFVPGSGGRVDAVVSIGGSVSATFGAAGVESGFTTAESGLEAAGAAVESAASLQDHSNTVDTAIAVNHPGSFKCVGFSAC